MKNVFLITSKENTCTGVSLFIKLQVEDPPILLKRDFIKGLFLCVFQSTFWCELIFFCCCCCCCWLIFSCCCCCWFHHINFLIKSLLTHWVDKKLFSYCWLPLFRMPVYVLLKFDWLIISFLQNLERKLRILNFFFSLIFFSAIFQMSPLSCSVLKLNGIFCLCRIFNSIEN